MRVVCHPRYVISTSSLSDRLYLLLKPNQNWTTRDRRTVIHLDANCIPLPFSNGLVAEFGVLAFNTVEQDILYLK